MQLQQDRDPIELMRQIVASSDTSVRTTLERAGYRGMTRSVWVTLEAVAAGTVSPARLRSTLGVTQQFVSKVVKTLAAMGCVEQAAVGADRRRRDITMTPRGQRAIDIIAAQRAQVSAAMPELTADETPTALYALRVRLERERSRPVDTAAAPERLRAS